MGQGRKLPDLLCDDEQVALFAAMPTSSFTAIRNRACFALMAYMGLRVSEVCDLTPRRVRWTTGDIKVIGKGKRERLLPLVAEAQVELDRWKAIRPSSSWFLCTRSGSRVSRNYLNRALKMYAERALARVDGGELPGLSRVHCHQLRHGFATALLRKTGNLELVRKALGHASIKTTTIYAHLTNDDLRAAMCDQDHKNCGPDQDRLEQIAQLQQQLAAIQGQLNALLTGQ